MCDIYKYYFIRERPRAQFSVTATGSLFNEIGMAGFSTFYGDGRVVIGPSKFFNENYLGKIAEYSVPP